ncbi:MAG: hypothetical protein ACO3G4_10265 [Opitutaceae bacterium]
MSAAILVRLLLWLWLGGALAAGHYGTWAQLPPLGQGALVLTLALGAFSLAHRLNGLASWIDGLDLRALLLPHACRLAGIYLVVRHLEGDLPRAFMLAAGIGEAVLAVVALPLALAPLPDAARARATRIWAVAALLNLVLVLATMVRLNLQGPLLLRELQTLPLSLFPTFLFPLALAGSALVLRRATRAPAA